MKTHAFETISALLIGVGCNGLLVASLSFGVNTVSSKAVASETSATAQCIPDLVVARV